MSSFPASPEDLIRRRAAWISAAASVLILALKAVAYLQTHSAAFLSDALESIVNVLAAFVALYVVGFAAQPADKEHPYGHGKAEYFSSTFEGGMIFFAALMIIIESVKALLQGRLPENLESGLLIMGFAALLNLILGLYLRRVGTVHKSEALKASGAHVLSDVLTTIGVMVGLGIVLLTHLPWLDPVVAILVGLQLAYMGVKIVRESIGGLMDETDESALQSLTEFLQKNRHPGIIDIHHLRMIRSGRFHHVDAHLVVPEYWDISHAHQQVEEFEKATFKDYEFDGEIAFHIDPCQRAYCAGCEVSNCPIRVAPFERVRPFTLKSLTRGPEPTKSGAYEQPTSTN